MANGRCRLYIGDGSNYADEVNVGSFINNNTWHHLVMVADKLNTMQLFIDGVPQGTAIDISHVTGDITNASNFRMGAPAFFNGAIDDVKIFERVLSEAQILQLATNF